jgi:hypothetical protein
VIALRQQAISARSLPEKTNVLNIPRVYINDLTQTVLIEHAKEKMMLIIS